MQLISRHPDNNWQTLLRESSISLPQLMEQLQLSQADLADASPAAGAEFALRVPRPYLARIEPGNPHDPLLRQVLPLGEELVLQPGYSQDPLAEMQSNPAPGLVHKYKSRVLLVVSGACAIHCRYCFRRHFPYQDNSLGGQQWQQVLTYIRSDNSITEVILSGGDPLATPDSRLARMITDLEQIKHLKRLRIHTRLPVVIPQRVTSQLLTLLHNSRLKSVVVVHINHPNEIDAEVKTALTQLKSSGVELLNQAVLLRGVNDKLPTLIALSEAVFAAGALPYYLFTLDAVQGAAHFDVPDTEAVTLFKALQAELPGYLVPRLAREIPNKPSKTLLGL